MERPRELARVARLYYIHSFSQREIAGRLGTSIATVSRALARARSEGIVTFGIHADREESLHALEAAVEDTFGLHECRVADPDLPVTDGLAVEMGTVLERVSREAGPIGVSWGTTLKAISERLPRVAATRAEIVPMLGAMGRLDTGIFPNTIAHNFAEALGGVNALVNVPAILDSAETRATLLKDGSFAHIAHLWERLSVAIFSVSPLTTGASMHTSGLFSASVLEGLRADGAVAALNFTFLDETGRSVETDLGQRIVCASQETIGRARHRILAAYGPEKLQALVAALAGGHATVLLTNQATAEGLIEDRRRPPVRSLSP